MKFYVVMKRNEPEIRAIFCIFPTTERPSNHVGVWVGSRRVQRGAGFGVVFTFFGEREVQPGFCMMCDRNFLLFVFVI